jgi:hypothetical protein
MTKKLNNEKVKLERVDFHKLMKNMPELFEFMKKIFHQNEFESYEWSNQNVLKKQKGVFRVNCIDNLDRTNV